MLNLIRANVYKLVANLIFIFGCLSASLTFAGPQVEVRTNLGNFIVELDTDRAPVASANFLNYVKNGFYNGLIFHRIIDGFMIQGGGFTSDLIQKPTNSPIISEAQNGLKNQTYTIATARTSDPNSATSQFFINLKDNPGLDYPNAMGNGYTVFGKVISGTQTIDAIRKVPTMVGSAPIGRMADVPTRPIIIESAVRIGSNSNGALAATTEKINSQPNLILDSERKKLEDDKRQIAEERKRLEEDKQNSIVQSAPPFTPPTSFNQGKRLALVIGNSAYQSRPLNNPRNDADDVSKALKGTGFEVIDLRDATLPQMRLATRQFGERLMSNDVGLVYYSGHGIEVKGKNYFIPVNADIKSSDEVADQALDVSLILAKMDSAKKGINILIVDACRDDPFGRSYRSNSRGLAAMDAPQGTIIAYATSPGNVASDGAGRNSPYTRNLVKAMQTPNLPVELMFKEVRRAVREETKNQQTPWENTSLSGNFYFKVQK